MTANDKNMMPTCDKNLEIMQLKNRVALLKSRDEENGNIIKKCERKIRNIEKKN